MMANESLPISEERLEELAEGLSPDARAIMDRAVANAELPPELRQDLPEILEGIDELSEEENARLTAVFAEVEKAYARRIRESEAVVDMSERMQAVFERAVELDDSLGKGSTLEDAVRVLREHGERVPFTEEEMHVEIAVPAGLEEADWIAIPESEIPTDENGIPTERAARHGVGFEDGDGNVVKLYPLQVEAMRAISKKIPFKKHVEEMLEDLAELKREHLVDLRELADASGEHGEQSVAEGLGVTSLDEAAGRLVSNSAHQAYLAVLAQMVKDAPDARGIIDFYEGRETKSAKRFKDWTVKRVVEENMEEMIEEGIFESVVGADGKEYIKPGPNYEQLRREFEEE
jgi:hypothetical protein